MIPGLDLVNLYKERIKEEIIQMKEGEIWIELEN